MSEQLTFKKNILSQLNTLSDFKMTLMIKLDDVKQLIHLNDLGIHSYTHSSMEFETDDYMKNDYVKCKEWFARQFNRSVNIYAFPSGSNKDRHVNFALEAGSKHFLLVNDLFSFIEAHIHPRFGFHFDSFSEMRFRVTGGLCKI